MHHLRTGFSMRAALCCSLAVLVVGEIVAPSRIGALENDRPSFDRWLSELRAEAAARGVREETLALALDRLEPLPIVVERDLQQPEFKLSLDAYLKRRLTKATIRTARAELTRHRALLRRIQKAYGVDPATLVAVWGLESNFGRFSGVRPTIATLATLAYEPRRSQYFREELFEALAIVDRGDIDFARMRGSWAGAMGQPQFMPSSYARYAVDFDHDGHRDIWSSPPDVFASIANYLKAHGWVPGVRWGREVRVPRAAEARVSASVSGRATGCRAVLDMSGPLPLSTWRRLGVTLVGGKAVPASKQAASLLRLDSRAFLLYGNYEALLGYNCAHTYALSVALLSDRLASR